MNISGQGIKWLQGTERLFLFPYDDQIGKRIDHWVPGATIGYGHLISKSDWDKYSKGLSIDQADRLFKSDLAPFESAVNKVRKQFTQNQFDACVILAFNIGILGFNSSTVRRFLENPDYKSSVYKNLEQAWKAYNKSQGKVSAGLTNRRNAEWDIYSKNIYHHW